MEKDSIRASRSRPTDIADARIQCASLARRSPFLHAHESSLDSVSRGTVFLGGSDAVRRSQWAGGPYAGGPPGLHRVQSPRLRNNRLDGLGRFHAGKFLVEPLKGKVQFVVVDAQLVEHGRV